MEGSYCEPNAVITDIGQTFPSRQDGDVLARLGQQSRIQSAYIAGAIDQDSQPRGFAG
jgi:hypothetical protein